MDIYLVQGLLSYNGRDLLTGITLTGGSTAVNAAYTYNSLGLLEYETFTFGGVTSNNHHYYSNGRLSELTNSVGDCVFTYDANGNITQITDYSNYPFRVWRYTYDSLNQLTSATDNITNTTTTYTYDISGNAHPYLALFVYL